MKLTCPDCGEALAAENLNVQADTALCQHCGGVSKLSLLVHKEAGLPMSLYSGNEEPEAVIPLDDYPPKGSKLEVYELGQTGDIEMFMPAKGFSGSTLFLGGFATFWLCFVSFWTFMASHAGPFALFSIPFWVVGVGLMTSVVRGVSEKQALRFGEHTLTLIRYRLFGKKTETVKIEDIDAVLGGQMPITSPFKAAFMVGHARSLQSVGTGTRYGNSGTQSMDVPNLRLGVKTISFFEGTEGVEKDWLVHQVKKLINERRSRPL